MKKHYLHFAPLFTNNSRKAHGLPLRRGRKNRNAINDINEFIDYLDNTLCSAPVKYNENYFSQWFTIISYNEALEYMDTFGGGFSVLCPDGTDFYADLSTKEQIKRYHDNGALFGIEKSGIDIVRGFELDLRKGE